MDEIAERAGVTKPVLYDHFGSKDGLLAAVVTRAGDELRAAIAAAVRDAAGAEQALARGLNAYFSFIAGRSATWLTLLTETSGKTAAARALDQVREAQAKFIADLFVTEVPSTERDRALTYAQVVVGACERLATYAAERAALDPAALTARLMDVIWLGFRAVRDGEGWSP